MIRIVEFENVEEVLEYVNRTEKEPIFRTIVKQKPAKVTKNHVKQATTALVLPQLVEFINKNKHLKMGIGLWYKKLTGQNSNKATRDKLQDALDKTDSVSSTGTQKKYYFAARPNGRMPKLKRTIKPMIRRKSVVPVEKHELGLSQGTISTHDLPMYPGIKRQDFSNLVRSMVVDGMTVGREFAYSTIRLEPQKWDKFVQWFITNSTGISLHLGVTDYFRVLMFGENKILKYK